MPLATMDVMQQSDVQDPTTIQLEREMEEATRELRDAERSTSRPIYPWEEFLGLLSTIFKGQRSEKSQAAEAQTANANSR